MRCLCGVCPGPALTPLILHMQGVCIDEATFGLMNEYDPGDDKLAPFSTVPHDAKEEAAMVRGTWARASLSAVARAHDPEASSCTAALISLCSPMWALLPFAEGQGVHAAQRSAHHWWHHRRHGDVSMHARRLYELP